MSWYKAGTVSVTNGNAVVTGTGTAFVANVKAGDAFVGPDDRSYEIVTVNSNTSLTISPAYLGSNQSGQSYRIQPTNGITVDLTAAVRDLITNYSGVLDGAGAGMFADGTVAAPGVRFTNDQDTGFYRSAANTMAAVTGGVARQVWTANGDVGIGTTSPAFNNGGGLEVERAGVAALRLENTANAVRVELVAGTDSVDLDTRTAHPFILKWSGTERVRFLPTGLSGFNTPSPQGVVDIYSIASNHLRLTTDNYQWRQYVSAANGDFLIDDRTNNLFPFKIESGAASNSLVVLLGNIVEVGAVLRPATDNNRTLGDASKRWSVVYAGTGAINTSDKRAKNWQRGTLTEGEIAAGERIIEEVGFFQFLDAIAEKGVEGARWHFGALAQDVVRIFIDEGVEAIDPDLLDIEPNVFVAEEDRPSMRQAFLTFDTWDAEYEDEYETVTVTRLEEQGQEPTGLLDAFGNPIMHPILVEVSEQVQQPTGNQILARAAGNIFGFRTDQLTMFLLRVEHELRLRDRAAAELRMDAQDARMDALEQRIEALEGV